MPEHKRSFACEQSDQFYNRRSIDTRIALVYRQRCRRSVRRHESKSRQQAAPGERAAFLAARAKRVNLNASGSGAQQDN
jgi:hypothetical protein